MKKNIFSFRGKTDLLGERRVIFFGDSGPDHPIELDGGLSYAPFKSREAKENPLGEFDYTDQRESRESGDPNRRRDIDRWLDIQLSEDAVSPERAKEQLNTLPEGEVQRIFNQVSEKQKMEVEFQEGWMKKGEEYDNRIEGEKITLGTDMEQGGEPTEQQEFLQTGDPFSEQDRRVTGDGFEEGKKAETGVGELKKQEAVIGVGNGGGVDDPRVMTSKNETKTNIVETEVSDLNNDGYVSNQEETTTKTILELDKDEQNELGVPGFARNVELIMDDDNPENATRIAESAQGDSSLHAFKDGKELPS